MTAEIISVGTELLLGNILNTNAQYLSRELAALGITVRRQSTIGDNHGRLAEFVNEAKQRCDLLGIEQCSASRQRAASGSFRCLIALDVLPVLPCGGFVPVVLFYQLFPAIPRHGSQPVVQIPIPVVIVLCPADQVARRCLQRMSQGLQHADGQVFNVAVFVAVHRCPVFAQHCSEIIYG